MQIDIDVMPLFDDLFGFAQDVQVDQSQEIHFQQTDFGHILHRVLHHGAALAAAFGDPLQRHIFIQRLFGDNHTGGMGAAVAGNSFHLEGGVDQFAYDGVFIIYSLQFGHLFQRMGQVNTRA